MSTIVTRLGKGTALTWQEADANFTNLNLDKVEEYELASSTGSSMVGYLPEGTGAVTTTVQSKLRETVSVNDFGADPTGSTNSYAAFVAAIAATPTGGTLKLNGTYRCSAGLVISKSMTIAGVDHRVANVPSGALSKSFLYFDTTVAIGIDIQGCVVTIDGVVVNGIGAGDGIHSRSANNSLILTGGSVVQGFNTGVRLVQGYYNKIDNATITNCANGLVADYVYNLVASALTVRCEGASTQGITLINGSQMTMLGGSIENTAVSAVGVLGGSSITVVGTYFENQGGWDFFLQSNASVNIIGCHVYANTGTSRFVSVEDSSTTGVRVYSRNNRIIYPTDTRTYVVYRPVLNDPTCYWDVAGDNWASPIGANVTYTPGGWFALKGNATIQFPAGHPNCGKNLNTVPFSMEPAIAAVSGTPKGSMQVFWGNAGFAGDDPLGLRATAWGYNSYQAIYQNGQWEKVGVRLPNQANSTAATLADLVTDFNALLTKLRNSGAMV